MLFVVVVIILSWLCYQWTGGKDQQTTTVAIYNVPNSLKFTEVHGCFNNRTINHSLHLLQTFGAPNFSEMRLTNNKLIVTLSESSMQIIWTHTSKRLTWLKKEWNSIQGNQPQQLSYCAVIYSKVQESLRVEETWNYLLITSRQWVCGLAWMSHGTIVERKFCETILWKLHYQKWGWWEWDKTFLAAAVCFEAKNLHKTEITKIR